MPTQPDPASAANAQELALIAALDDALDRIEDARTVVGRNVPKIAEKWAEDHGLEVNETAFAPPGRIYITGAIPVHYGVPS